MVEDEAFAELSPPVYSGGVSKNK